MHSLQLTQKIDAEFTYEIEKQRLEKAIENEKEKTQSALDEAKKKENELTKKDEALRSKCAELREAIQNLEKVNEKHAIQVASQFRLLTCARISENQLR